MPAAFLTRRRQARAGARLGRAPDARRGLRGADRSADRAVRGRLDRGLPPAVPPTRRSASWRCSTNSSRNARQRAPGDGRGGLAGRRRVCRAIEAFVAHLIAHQALLRIAFIDLFEVGPAMIGRMTRSVADFTACSPSRRPPAAARAADRPGGGHRRGVGSDLDASWRTTASRACPRWSTTSPSPCSPPTSARAAVAASRGQARRGTA